MKNKSNFEVATHDNGHSVPDWFAASRMTCWMRFANCPSSLSTASSTMWFDTKATAHRFDTEKLVLGQISAVNAWNVAPKPSWTWHNTQKLGWSSKKCLEQSQNQMATFASKKVWWQCVKLSSRSPHDWSCGGLLLFRTR